MGKNIKSYATTQVHSPGKGREALWQKVQIFHLNMVRLNHTYYSLLNFTSKIFQILLSFGQNSSSKIHSIRLYTPQIAQNSHRLLTYLYYVSGTCPCREPCKIPANYANSAQFAHTVRKSCEICTICSHYIHYISDA